MFGLIGLLLVILAGAFIASRQSRKVVSHPVSAEDVQKIPADVEKKLKKITDKYPEVKD